MRKRRNKRRLRPTWALDRIRFGVSGAGCQRFLTACSVAGLKLWGIRCRQDGYTAWALGINAEQLHKLAEKGGWSLEIQERYGPGRMGEGLAARPGIVTGAMLAIALLKLFTSFVWNIDFGTAEDPEKIRDLLFHCGIIEGAAVNDEKLKFAEQNLQSEDENGWVSLNFAEGCLFVETNTLRQQQIKTQDAETALYSKSDALVLSADVQSGFVAVDIGQYVAKGQLLVDNARFGRKGNMVKQGAVGHVIGRLEKTYTATCKTTEMQNILNGKSNTETTFSFLGRSFGKESDERIVGQLAARETISRQPLRFGQLALPGCRQITTRWAAQKLQLKHTPEYAEATAKRLCRLQLAEEFPDAIVENQEIVIEKDATVVTATCRYTVRANLTQTGTPPDHIFIEP